MMHKIEGEVESPNAVPEVEAPTEPAVPMPAGVLRETPQVVSRIDTTPDTAAGRVRIHFDLQEQGKGPVRGMVGLEPDQAVKLANNLHKDAAFVNRYKKKRR